MDISDRILEIFKAIAQVPRQSKHEEKISAWLVERAKEDGFEVIKDEAMNVIIRVPATPGYENGPVVVLQGHMDMVCEKTPDSDHNFDTDPIEVIIEDGWMHANKTSLGADDGLGVAMALAMVEDKTIEHPALEILITSDEETGMTGATALKPELLKGRIYMNLDSEDEGIFTIGCAGGRETVSTLPLIKEAAPDGFSVVSVHITGLLGGHSGTDINLGRASALKLATRAMSAVLAISPEARLVDIKGGSAHNAIPRDATFSVAVPSSEVDKVVARIDEVGKIFAAEYANTDAGVQVASKVSDVTGPVYSNDSLRKVSDLLFVYPHGVQAMSQEVGGLVETSDNLASCCIKGDALHLLSSQRSSVRTKLDAITSRIEACVRMAGGIAKSNEGYPSWQPKPDSDLVKRCIDVYKARFGREPVSNIIHAGLECGLIRDQIPDMDMVSFGPTILSPHSPRERSEVKTIKMVADVLIDLLKSYK